MRFLDAALQGLPVRVGLAPGLLDPFLETPAVGFHRLERSLEPGHLAVQPVGPAPQSGARQQHQREDGAEVLVLEEPHASGAVEAQAGAAGSQLEDVAVVQGHLVHRRAGKEGALPRAGIAENDAMALAHDVGVKRGSPGHEDLDSRSGADRRGEAREDVDLPPASTGEVLETELRHGHSGRRFPQDLPGTRTRIISAPLEAAESFAIRRARSLVGRSWASRRAGRRRRHCRNAKTHSPDFAEKTP